MENEALPVIHDTSSGVQTPISRSPVVCVCPILFPLLILLFTITSLDAHISRKHREYNGLEPTPQQRSESLVSHRWLSPTPRSFFSTQNCVVGSGSGGGKAPHPPNPLSPSTLNYVGALPPSPHHHVSFIPCKALTQSSPAISFKLEEASQQDSSRASPPSVRVNSPSSPSFYSWTPPHRNTPSNCRVLKVAHRRRGDEGGRGGSHFLPSSFSLRTRRLTALNMMFENFTERAIQVIMLAQEESRRVGHNFVGTEQIFLGLISQTTGLAGRVLKSAGISLKEARQRIEDMLGRGSGFVVPEIPFTPTAKEALQRAVEEAKLLGHSYIDTEHLLLGVLKKEDGSISNVLRIFGVEKEKLKSELIKLIGEAEEFTVVGGGDRSKTTPKLQEYSTDLTEKAAKGLLDPVVGRTKEIERVIQILVRRLKSNPVLIGEPGVGKTAIAEALAQRISSKEVPVALESKRVCMLDMGLLVAGTKYRGEFEDRLNKILEDIKKAGNIILVVDEIHTLIGAGAGEGALDAANLLKPALARGEFQCIGATTLDEYKRYFEKDTALERRFMPVMIKEPTTQETIEILRGISPKFEKFHKLTYSDDALVMAVKYAEQYISHRNLPDKAIDLIDEAGSSVKIRYSKIPEAAWQLDDKLKKNLKDQEDLQNSFNETSLVRLQEEELAIRKDLLKYSHLLPKSSVPNVYTANIADVVASWTGIDVSKLTKTDAERLLCMEEALQQRFIGQTEAVKSVSRAIRRAKSGIKNPRRPIASFLFCGPTGVGKTELSKALANFLFDSEDSLIRLDMSEYMEKYTISKLVGSPPGYVGHEEGGQLTELVRRKPYSVILLDEIEKAHPDVFNILLQILEDGRLTDGKGRTVDFKNAILILTSNLGSKVIERASSGGSVSIGFDAGSQLSEDQKVYSKIKSLVEEELVHFFRPEFLNRLDEIIVFTHLSKEEISLIIGLMLEGIFKRALQMHLNVVVTNRFKDKIASTGFDSVYGARPLRRALTRMLEDTLAEAKLTGKIQPHDDVVVDVDEGGEVIVSRKEDIMRAFQEKLTKMNSEHVVSSSRV